MTTAGGIALLIGVVVVIMVIRFIIKKGVDKGADAIQNAYRRKKEAESPARQENLSDRYK